MMIPSSSIRVIPNKHLHISEPNPSWFGNKANPLKDSNEYKNNNWNHSNWLQSRFHFSFAEYSNHKNSNFGVLRVMNDDLVQPHRGFGAHPHSNMEILTYIVQGTLTHQDSLGTKESLGRGSIQFMTAGKGVVHSEHNLGDKPLRFIQTWVIPSRRNLDPRYGSCSNNNDDNNDDDGDDDVCVDGETKTTEINEKNKENNKNKNNNNVNKLQHLVSNIKDDTTNTPVEIHQDLDGYACELEYGKSVSLELPEGRQAYLLCIEGGVKINGSKVLSKYDGCEIMADEGGVLDIEAIDVEETENGRLAHILLYVMKSVAGSGRSDF